MGLWEDWTVGMWFRLGSMMIEKNYKETFNMTSIDFKSDGRKTWLCNALSDETQ